MKILSDWIKIKINHFRKYFNSIQVPIGKTKFYFIKTLENSHEIIIYFQNKVWRSKRDVYGSFWVNDLVESKYFNVTIVRSRVTKSRL